MNLINLLMARISDRSERCVESLELAICESRNDDGSLRFRESIFYRLPMHERKKYLHAISESQPLAMA